MVTFCCYYVQNKGGHDTTLIKINKEVFMDTKNVFIYAIEKALSHNEWQKMNAFSTAMNKTSKKRGVS